MFEGLGSLGGYRRKRRRRRSGRRSAAQSRLGRAAKACKGKKKGAFRACVRAKMRRGR